MSDHSNLPKRRITKRVVDALKAGTAVWDIDVTGFGVRCQRRDKVYVLKVRIHGRQRWFSIGKHGAPWTPETARRKAITILGAIANGEDPSQHRDEKKHDLTITELCDLYVAEGCSTKKPSTLATDQGRIERHIKPLLGRRFVRSIVRADIERFMMDVANGNTAADIKTGPRGRAIVRGGKGTASKAVSLLGAIFTFAQNRGLCAEHPVRGIKTFQNRRMERFLSVEEVSRLGDALAQAEASGGNVFAIAAIRLLAMTGCRKSEILHLRWGDIDYERSMFSLNDSKTGARAVAVGAPVLKILSLLPRVEGSPYVLPGRDPAKPLVGLPKVWRKIREAAGLSDVRLHDLRHSYASEGVSAGDSLYVIGKLLGHNRAATTQRYAHIHDDPLRAAADRISSRIERSLSRQDHEAANVTQMKR